MAAVDMDHVVRQTLQQLGAENALLRLELNTTRAALAATEAEPEQAKATPAEEATDD